MSPQNGRITRPVNAEFVEYLGVVIYVCDTGYNMAGNPRATCQEDGNLSSERPTCQRTDFVNDHYTLYNLYNSFLGVTCLNPGSPVNGGMTPDVETYAVGTRITWFCEGGYDMVGLPTAVCQGNRQFNNPTPRCRS